MCFHTPQSSSVWSDFFFFLFCCKMVASKGGCASLCGDSYVQFSLGHLKLKEKS